MLSFYLKISVTVKRLFLISHKKWNLGTVQYFLTLGGRDMLIHEKSSNTVEKVKRLCLRFRTTRIWDFLVATCFCILLCSPSAKNFKGYLVDTY